MKKEITGIRQEGWFNQMHSHVKWEGDDIVRTTLEEMLKSGSAIAVGQINHLGHVAVSLHERIYPEQYKDPWGEYPESHFSPENEDRRLKTKGLPDVRHISVKPEVAKKYDIASLMLDEIKRTGGPVAVSRDFNARGGTIEVKYFDGSETKS